MAPTNHALSVVPAALLAAPAAVGALEFTAEQRQIIRDTFAPGATDAEFAFLMEIARARRLSPLLRQIFFVQRWDSEKGRMAWATQVSIDGLRAVAERTGLYAGQDEPEFVENPDGTIKCCKVRVWRRDWPRPAVGVAYWSEYVQTTRDKQTGKTRPTTMWARMPHVMIAKCGEALALRKAFPEDMAGLYSADEMAQADVVDAPPTSSDVPARQINADVSQQPLGCADVTASVEPVVAPVVVAPPVPRVEVVHVALPVPPSADDDAAPVDPPAPPEPRVERDAANDTDAPPAALEPFYARLAEIELPGEVVAAWMKHRATIARCDAPTRETAWKAAIGRVESVGKFRNGKVWLKKAVAEEDARAAREAAAAAG